jgi:hypothetical protein
MSGLEIPAIMAAAETAGAGAVAAGAADVAAMSGLAMAAEPGILGVAEAAGVPLGQAGALNTTNGLLGMAMAADPEVFAASQQLMFPVNALPMSAEALAQTNGMIGPAMADGMGAYGQPFTQKLLGTLQDHARVRLLSGALRDMLRPQAPMMQADTSPVMHRQPGSFMEDRKRHLAQSDPRLFRIMYPQG